MLGFVGDQNDQGNTSLPIQSNANNFLSRYSTSTLSERPKYPESLRRDVNSYINLDMSYKFLIQ